MGVISSLASRMFAHCSICIEICSFEYLSVELRAVCFVRFSVDQDGRLLLVRLRRGQERAAGGAHVRRRRRRPGSARESRGLAVVILLHPSWAITSASDCRWGQQTRCKRKQRVAAIPPVTKASDASGSESMLGVTGDVQPGDAG